MEKESEKNARNSEKSSQLSPGGYYNHPRRFQDNIFVYPVLSRRSKGISVGVNLFSTKQCNFDCLYCQVCSSPVESADQQPSAISIMVLERELRQTLEIVLSKTLFELEAFRDVPKPLQRLNDIALSGDGEPTLAESFTDICQVCADVVRSLKLGGVKIVLLTNATCLHVDRVRQGLKILYDNNGEIWAKLDAGTEAFFHRMNNTSVPFGRILTNITETAKAQPVVIQSLFARLDHKTPPPEEIIAYADQLVRITETGGAIKLVQLHTVARPPRDRRITKLSRDELDAIASTIKSRASVPVEIYYQ